MALKTQPVTSRASAQVHTYLFAGYAFRIVSEVPVTTELLHDMLKAFATPVNGDAPSYLIRQIPNQPYRYTVHRDEQCLLDDTRAYPGAIVDSIMSDITRRGIEVCQQDFLTVHASAASWNDRGIIMPAHPDSGKTTTIAGLVRAGFDYLTDEAVLIDPETSLIHPFPRPLGMEPGSVAAVPGLHADLPDKYHETMPRNQYHVPYDYIRKDSLGRPCPVGYVVAPAYSKGSTTALQPMTRAEAAVLLVGQCFNFKTDPAKSLSVLAQVLRGAECYTLRVGDLHRAVDLIQELFAAER